MDTIIKTRSMFPGARRGLEPVGTPRGHNHELCYLNISIHILSPVHRGYVKIKYFPKEKNYHLLMYNTYLCQYVIQTTLCGY